MVHIAKYFAGKNARNTRIYELLDWVDEHADAMLDDPVHGLEAIGVGKKNIGHIADTDGQWCITGFVKKKIPESTLKKQNLQIFSSAATSMTDNSKQLAKIEMDVVEVGSAFTSLPGLNVPAAQRGQYGGSPPTVDFQKQFDSLRSGLGITNPVGSYPNGLSVGTFGFAVKDSTGQKYLISNNHVIARENNAQKGNAIVQPGTLDLTQTELSLMNTLTKLRNKLQIAKLSAWVDIDFSTVRNEVDVAIAEINDDRDLGELARIGFGSKARGIATKYSVDATGNMVGDTRVYKAGRTTGWTEGVVTSIGVASNITYGAGVARFKNQIAVAATTDNGGPFSDRGDSGSGVWNSANELVGLLFAGSSTNTLVNPIDRVMSEISAELNKGKLTLIT